MIRWVAALHGWSREVWDSYYERMPLQNVDDPLRSSPMDKTDQRYEEWGNTTFTLIPTAKGKDYESIFESWIRIKLTPYRLGSADLKATHWVLSVLTKRSIAIKCELPFWSRSL